MIGDSTVVNGDNLTALAVRTYSHRQYVGNPDWTYDSIQAARLDLASEVASDLVASTEKYQVYPSGLAAWNPSPVDEPYIEHDSNVAATRRRGAGHRLRRDAPVRPGHGRPAGTPPAPSYIQGGSRVDVQIEGGTLATAAIQAGGSGTLTVRNPWSGRQAEVVDGSSGAVVVAPTTAATFPVPVSAGSSYLVEQVSAPTTSLPFAQVTGTPARSYRQLGGVTIGLSGNSLPTGNDTVTVANPGNQSGASGTPINALQISATDSAAGQTLTYGATGLPPGLSISSSGLISGTPGSGGTFTTVVSATDTTGSSGSTSFTWTVSGATTGSTGALHAVGAGKCLDDPGSSTTQGTQVQIYACNGQANQTWTHGSSSQLSVTVNGTTLCLDANNNGTANGTKVILWGCNGQSNQQWTLNANGTVTGAQSGLCLDVTGASTANGALVELWACNGGSNQQWSLG